ncbi:MAG TPA: hypothetical protein ENJ54_03410 [Chloroflexi bacterium]|nr:hypothetical protein [Chloroflexota bacterium]
MATQEERLRILQMVAEGKVRPEEAAALLEALANDEGTGPAAVETSPTGQGHWLRIRVEEKGAQKVNIRLPWRMVDIGLKIARRFVPDADMGEISGALNEALTAGLPGKIIEVHDEEDDEHVEIWIE